MLGKHNDELVVRAAALCREAHEGQFRDGGEPYATHPAAVAEILRQYGVTDSATLAAAYLHDVLEDTEIPEAHLVADFGDDVTQCVRQLTNKGWPGRTREEKQQGLLAKAVTMSPSAKTVKLADRLHNLSQMESWNWEQQKRYANEAIELVEALRPWPISELAEAVLVEARRINARSS